MKTKLKPKPTNCIFCPLCIQFEKNKNLPYHTQKIKILDECNDAASFSMALPTPQD